MSFNRVHLEGRTGPHRFASFFTLFALFFAGASLVGAQEEAYVCVQGVPGDSVEADHTGWIVAYGLAHGTAGGGHGRPGLRLDRPGQRPFRGLAWGPRRGR